MRPCEALQFWIPVGHPSSAQEPWELLELVCSLFSSVSHRNWARLFDILESSKGKRKKERRKTEGNAKEPDPGLVEGERFQGSSLRSFSPLGPAGLLSALHSDCGWQEVLPGQF